MKKLFAAVLFFANLFVFVFLAEKYTHLLFFACVVIFGRIGLKWLLEKTKNPKMHVLILFLLSIAFLAVDAIYLKVTDPYSLQVQMRESWTYTWQGVIAVLVLICQYYIGLWSWVTLEISEFLTRQRL